MPKPKTDKDLDDFWALVKRTDKENPDPGDLKLIRKHLDGNIAFVNANEITQHAFAKAIEANGRSAVLREVYSRHIEEKRLDLGYQIASPIERMLIDQVVLCWFRLNQLEVVHAEKTSQNHTTEVGLYWDKRLNAAQRRFMKSCETLTKVQKCIAETDLRLAQSQTKRRQGAVLANKLLKDLTSG